MTTKQYIEQINTRFKSGISREHAYRGDLESLIRELVKGVEITNEPSNVTDCGNPDYVITKGKIPIGYVEAKDIGKDLNGKQYKEQFTRYKKALDNLIITDYIWFQFFQNGKLIHEIKIGEIEKNKINPITENFAEFENLITNFCSFIGQTIKSSKKLAEMMAGKAKLLKNILEQAITSDEITQENTSLKGQFEAFKKILIHDLKAKDFADIYAQTLAYGMFAARLHDKTLDDFSRKEAAELIPKTNPFLRKLFQYVAGYDIDERIVTTVDNLAEVFRATNVEQLLKNFGKSTQMHDPIIHFYETFLAKYDPKLRKSRGVWYTPQPVVNFIVRAVDDILKTEFGLSKGLADTSKTKIQVPTQEKNKTMEREVHKVQILDPATGTGTFLAEVVKLIYNNNFKSMQGAWSEYVEEHLIPRLNGFELLMASYSMAHLKLDMLLTETGYKSKTSQRYNIYLTNSLEKYHPDTGTLFSQWLSTEANEANHIKRDTPVMCVIGNPPYSGISINKGEWITNLIEDYKYVNGKHFGERKHWLQDDYVKFLRFGEFFINKNREGILAFINNHSFLDNPTFRGMRWHLLESFDKIYIIDLHGNSKKKEVCPDGSKDENVFDITAGVSINIFVKTGKKKKGKLAEVLHYDAWGKRQEKYDYLWNNSIKTIPFEKVNYREPFYFFVPKDFKGIKEYENGFKINELMQNNKTGIVSMGDAFIIEESKEKLLKNVNDFLENDYSEENLKQKYHLGKNYAKWIIENKNKIKIGDDEIVEINYRPFDKKWTIFNNKLLWRWRFETMQHLVKGKNIGLVTARQSTSDWRYIFITKLIGEFNLTGTAGRYGSGNYFPLYLYPENNGQQTIENSTERKPNLNLEIVNEISKKIGLVFIPEKSSHPDLLGGVPEGRGGNKQIHNLPYLKTFRKELRNNLTPAEATLWKMLQKRQLDGRKFRRQHSVANYILDFYCPSEKLAIELDGQGHFEATQAEYDYERDLFLKEFGIKVLRFENKIVFEDTEWMLEKIRKEFITTPAPPFKGGEQYENFAPIDILDYIYAVLHSPTYREKYKEFLKIDFPRVPYPKDKKTFWKLVKLGSEIRQIHLLESPKVEKYITSYPKDGDNRITRKLNKNDWEIVQTHDRASQPVGRIWINDEQYFDKIPLVAWEFYIGGYQPAQKWLKDRRKRQLSFEDILHYQKIIVALTETDRIMKKIDKIKI